MSDLLRTERDGPLLTLTLDNPGRANALTAPLAEALDRALEEAEAASGLRAVVITGAGRHFSAGADLAALRRVAEGGDEAANLAESRRLEALFARLLAHPKLTVAAVAGAAVAGGCGLATACDLVVAETSARFAYTEVTLGFVPALVSTFLTRRVPGHVARRLLLDPRMLDATEAAELGLVDELVAEGEALARAAELARSVCSKASPAAIAATKRLLDDCVGLAWRPALALAAEVNARQRRHPECRHGVRSFLEQRRTPDWLDDS